MTKSTFSMQKRSIASTASSLVVDDPGEHNVEEFHRRKYLFHIGVLAFGIRAPPEPFAQRLETGRRDQQQTCFRFSGFQVTIHV